MGIHGLSKLLNDNAPRCVREHKMEYFAGRKIAIDASMQIYQFLIAVRQQGGEGQLTNEAGEVTSHLTGMLYRTIRMMEAGIKPVFVFDGKPPTLKSGELAKRKERQQAAETELTRLQEQGGSAEDVERQQKRTVRASREQSEEVKKLLGLMGVPVVDAPCEAEATCAALAKAGLVYATATEDMDALTFATPLLIRNLNSPEARKLPIREFNLELALGTEGLDMSIEQFTDLCILCGCDYTNSIKGIGPVKALGLLKEHGSLEGILAHLRKKHTAEQLQEMIPDPFPFEEARRMFREPEVADTSATPAFKWSDPDVEGLKSYLIDEKQFGEERVLKAIERLKKCKGKSGQNRMEDFFGKATIIPNKRKEAEAAKGKGKGKAGKGPLKKAKK